MIHFIDDEPILRELLEELISDAGYKSIGFESGEVYIDYMNSPEFENPIAVLSDVTMPGINGYDLALEIRKLHPKQVVVLITGNADPEQHTQAARQVCYTLNKPYQPDKLLSMLDTLAACHKSHTGEEQKEYPQKCNIDHLTDCPFCPLNKSA